MMTFYESGTTIGLDDSIDLSDAVMDSRDLARVLLNDTCDKISSSRELAFNNIGSSIIKTHVSIYALTVAILPLPLNPKTQVYSFGKGSPLLVLVFSAFNSTAA